MSGLQSQSPSGVPSVKAGDGTSAVEMDQMECVCGEVLRGERGKGQLWSQYQEHLSRLDHQIRPGQWMKAHELIEKGKEKAKKDSAANTVRR